MSVTASVEVELKYAVPDDAPAPDLAGAEGVVAVEAQPVAHLEALYVDTADRVLLRARVALRRRTGGHDAGWHAKLPGPAGRHELHAPIDPADPDALPAALERVLRSRLRGRPVVPLARITTERRGLVVTTAGGGRVEVVDDAVEAVDVAAGATRRWREWEAEQLDEDGGAALALVDAALRAAGARRSASPAKLAQALGGEEPPTAPRPRTAGEHLDALVAAAAEEAHRRTAALVLGGDPDGSGVHGLRKTLRRIRSLLALRRVAGPAGAGLRERLGGLAAALGEARDPVVGADVAERLLAGLEGAPGAASARRVLVEEPRAGAAAASAAAVERLLDDEAVATWALLDGFAADGPEAGRGSKALRRAARRLQRQVVRRARRAHRGDLDGLHRVRKAGKRARDVALDLAAAGVLPGRALRDARRADRLQQRLGDHRDLALLLESLPARSVDLASAGGNAYALGVLHERGARRLARLERRARRAARRLAP